MKKCPHVTLYTIPRHNGNPVLDIITGAKIILDIAVLAF